MRNLECGCQRINAHVSESPLTSVDATENRNQCCVTIDCDPNDVWATPDTRYGETQKHTKLPVLDEEGKGCRDHISSIHSLHTRSSTRGNEHFNFCWVPRRRCRLQLRRLHHSDAEITTSPQILCALWLKDTGTASREGRLERLPSGPEVKTSPSRREGAWVQSLAGIQDPTRLPARK